ncbi:unnamed protein product, partial [Laminaria digitata]
ESIAFSALGQIYVMPRSGGPPTPLNISQTPQFHPSWSADGSRLLSVGWTNEQGGHVWETDVTTGTARRLTSGHAFYTHPVYAPNSDVLVIRSRTEDRNASYLEFGQFRDAELVRLSDDGEPVVEATGMMGGKPHFLESGAVLLNRPDGVYRLDDETSIASVSGPNWYFAEGPAPVDDIKVSPDGQWALAKIAQQLHLVALDQTSGKSASPLPTDLAYAKVTDVGAD